MDRPSSPIRHSLSAGEHDLGRPYVVEHTATVRLTEEAAALVASGDVGGLNLVLQHVTDALRVGLVATCDDRGA